MPGSRTLRFDLVADVDRFSRPLGVAGRDLDVLGTRTDRAGRAVDQFGGRLDQAGNRVGLFGAKTATSADRSSNAVLRMGGIIGVQSGLSARNLGIITGAAVGAGEAVSTLAGSGVALGSLAADLAGVGAAGAQAGSAIAQAAGVGELASAGIGDALKEQATAQQATGASAASSAAQQVSSARQIRGAREGLAAANRAEVLAQRDLTAARRDARGEMQDLTLAARSASDAQAGAAIALRQARESLVRAQDDQATGDASQLDVDAAEQAVRSARTQLAESRARAQDARQAAETAQRGGVDRMPAVVQAQQQLTDAQRDVARSARDVREATEDAGRGTLALAAAQAKGTAAMDKLSPAARRFAQFLIGLRPELEKTRAVAAAGLFPGVEAGVRSALGSLDEANVVTGRTARSMGDVSRAAGELVGSGPFGRDLQTVGTSNSRVIRLIGLGLVDLASAARHVLVEAGPMTESLARGFREWATYVDTAAEAGRESGRMADYFDRSEDTTRSLVSIVGDLGHGLWGVSKGGRAAGDDLLGGLERYAARFDSWANSVRGQDAIGDWTEESVEDLRKLRDFLGSITGDVDWDDGNFGERLGIVIEKSQPHISDAFQSVVEEAVPILAENVAEAAPRIAGAFVQAFTDTNVWGRIALVTLILAKTGGLGGLRRAGVAAGAAWGGGFQAGAKPGTMVPAPAGPVGRGAGRAAPAAAGPGRGAGVRREALPGTTARGQYPVSTVPRREVLPGTVAPGRYQDPRRFGGLRTAGARVLGGGALAGRGALALTGGPAGAALLAATLLGPSVYNAGRNRRSEEFHLRERSGAQRLTDRLRLGGAGRALLGNSTENYRVQRFGERAEGRFARAEKQMDPRALAGLAKEARNLAKDTDQGRKGLLAIAAAAEKSGRRVAAANRLFGRGKVGADDVVDRLAAVRVARRLEDMRTSSAKSLGGLRRDVDATSRGIEQGFAAGSKGASEAYRRNFRNAITGVEGLMSKGKTSAGRGAKEIRGVVETQMRLMSAGVIDNSGESQKALTENLTKGFDSAISNVRRGGGITKDEMKAMKAIVRSQTDAVASDMAGNSEKGKTALARNLTQARRAIEREMKAGGREARIATRGIRSDLDDALKDLGVTRSGAPGDRKRGQETGGGPTGSGTGRERGGWVGARGMVGPDSVPIMGGHAVVAPGEAILGHPTSPAVVNRHQVDHVDHALAFTASMGAGQYGSLDALFGGVNARHSDAKATGVPPGYQHFARGGYVQGAKPPSGPASGPIRGLASRLFAKGYNVTSGSRGGGTNHQGQTAIDFGDSVNDLRRLWGVLWPQAKRFDELFGPSSFGGLYHFGKRFSNSRLQAGHEDHIHVALKGALKGALGRGMAGGPGGDAAVAIPKLKRMRVKGLGGKTEILAQTAVDKYQRAAQRYLEKKAASAGAGNAGAGAGAKAGAANEKQVRSWLYQGLKAAGETPSSANITTLYGRVMQESGGNPRAQNNWDSNAKAGTPSKGLLQTIEPTFRAHMVKGMVNIWNPVHNVAAAVRYMKSRYGRLVGRSGSGYSRGGRIGPGGRRIVRSLVKRYPDLLEKVRPSMVKGRWTGPLARRMPARGGIEGALRVAAPDAFRNLSVDERRELEVQQGNADRSLTRMGQQFGLDEEDLSTTVGLVDATWEESRTARGLDRVTGLAETAYEDADEDVDDIVTEEKQVVTRSRADLRSISRDARLDDRGIGRARGRENRSQKSLKKRIKAARGRGDETAVRALTVRQRASQQREARLTQLKGTKGKDRRALVAKQRKKVEGARDRTLKASGEKRRELEDTRAEALRARDDARFAEQEQEKAAIERTGAHAVLEADLGRVDDLERAGVITADRASQMREEVTRKATSRTDAGRLTERQALTVRGDRRERALGAGERAVAGIDRQARAGGLSETAAAGQRVEAHLKAMADGMREGLLTPDDVADFKGAVREGTLAGYEAAGARIEREASAGLFGDPESQRRRRDEAVNAVVDEWIRDLYGTGRLSEDDELGLRAGVRAGELGVVEADQARVDRELRAGVYGNPEDAAAQARATERKLAIINGAIYQEAILDAMGQGRLSDDDMLDLRGAVNDNTKALKDQAEADRERTEAQKNFTESVKTLEATMAAVNGSVAGTALGVLADVVNGSLGASHASRAQTAGSGVNARY